VKAGSTLVYYVSIANTSNLDYRLDGRIQHITTPAQIEIVQ